MVFERFATKPSVRVTWSKEIRLLQGGDAIAVITALIVKDTGTRPSEMRGIRIDLRGGEVEDSVFVEERFLERLLEALAEAARGMGERFQRTSPSVCFGSGLFLQAVRDGAHFFHASQCSMSDGWYGLSVITGEAMFRFTNLDPAPFASAIHRAARELKQQPEK
jgi:hypothetical protein